jgi:type IV secretory pathway TrbL component
MLGVVGAPAARGLVQPHPRAAAAAVAAALAAAAAGALAATTGDAAAEKRPLQAAPATLLRSLPSAAPHTAAVPARNKPP